MSTEWERGFVAGWNTARTSVEDLIDISESSEFREPMQVKAPASRRRGPTAYNKRYGKAFKKLAPKYKKKDGSWKKDGFKRCGAAARKLAKKGSTKKGQVRKTARRAYER